MYSPGCLQFCTEQKTVLLSVRVSEHQAVVKQSRIIKYTSSLTPATRLFQTFSVCFGLYDNTSNPLKTRRFLFPQLLLLTTLIDPHRGFKAAANSQMNAVATGTVCRSLKWN